MQPSIFFRQQHSAMRAFRRNIHAHPELSFEEFATAEKVVQKLRAWGIETHTGLAKTGVMGVIRKGASGVSIMLRADMDALPVQELNTFEHKSTVDGVMHACGHDGHTTMLLAAAEYLQKYADFDGTVYLLFQPAEEHGGGANELLKEGLFEQFPADMVFGMHNWPDLPAGTFAVSEGAVMASSNEFSVTIQGKACHAAMPHEGVDPVLVAAHVITALQSIVSRNTNPAEFAEAVVVSVTMVQAGEVNNAVPETCMLQGTVRTFSDAVTDVVAQRMDALIQGVCAGFGASAEFVFNRGYPPTVNHTRACDVAKQAVQQVIRDHAQTAETMQTVQLVHQHPTMGAEDFAFLLQKRQGCYVFIGNMPDGETGNGTIPPCMLHNPHYDFNDNIIPLGAHFWVRLVQHFLEVS